MKVIECNKCNLAIANPTNVCLNCGSKGVECQYLTNPSDELLEKLRKDGFQIVIKKLVTESTGEEDVLIYEYKLQKPIK